MQYFLISRQSALVEPEMSPFSTLVKENNKIQEKSTQTIQCLLNDKLKDSLGKIHYLENKILELEEIISSKSRQIQQLSDINKSLQKVDWQDLVKNIKKL
jgi:hypothetical protein